MDPIVSAWGPAAQLAEAIARRGAKVTLRAQTKTPGPNTLLNPPRVMGTTVAGPHGAGVTAIALAAITAAGRLVAGDKLLIGGVEIAVAADTAARTGPGGQGFLSVPVTPLPRAFAGGETVGFKFKADYPTFAMIDTFPARLVDGERIQARDLSVRVSAYKLPMIEPTWLFLLNGREMSIATASPDYERGEVVAWNLQAR